MARGHQKIQAQQKGQEKRAAMVCAGGGSSQAEGTLSTKSRNVFTGYGKEPEGF